MRCPPFCICVSIYLLIHPLHPFAQDSGTADNSVHLPSEFFSRIHWKTAELDQQLTRQTQKYLQHIAKQEEQLRKKISKVDSNAARNLFQNSGSQYASFIRKIKDDSSAQPGNMQGEYLPYVDSLRNSLAFLQENPQLLSSSKDRQHLQASLSQLQQLQSRMQDADKINQYIHNRSDQLKQYISNYSSLPANISSGYQNLNKEIFYYHQQLQEYKQTLNDPDRLQQKVLAILNRLPSWQQFIKNNGALAGLFNLPGNDAAAQSIAGLQTRDQVSQLVQNQVSAGGAGGAAALQSNLQSAQSQLDGLKNRLSSPGGGSNIDMPDFKPNDQKTKTFWKRLEYGANFQTTHNSYYFPIVTDLGLSLGYRLGHAHVVGLGASYKVGWGRDIQHVELSGQGVGLRSFIDINIKKSFSATGGLEYNYTTPFSTYQQLRQLQYWTRSGLIGISKTVSLKSHVFRNTKLQLLWDFLSHQQVPKTQPILFRIGYSF
jgi:hypothetical protein